MNCVQLLSVVRSLSTSGASTIPLSALSSQLALTIAYRIILACLLYVWPTLTVFDALQHILWGQLPKYSHVTSYLLEVLHWLSFRQRVQSIHGRLHGVEVPVGQIQLTYKII